MHDPSFRLKWWRIRPWRGHHGLTVNAFNDSERHAIRQWCAANSDIAKITKEQTWLDSTAPTGHVSVIGHWPGGLRYVERQMQIYGTDPALQSLERFLAALPVRGYEILVQGIDRSYLQEICTGTNHRLIRDIRNQLLHGISTNDRDLIFELTLRSDTDIM